MIEKYHIQIKKTAIYNFLSEYKSSEKVYDKWHINRQRPIITITKCDQSIEKYFDKTGRAMTTRDIEIYIKYGEAKYQC